MHGDGLEKALLSVHTIGESYHYASCELIVIVVHDTSTSVAVASVL